MSADLAYLTIDEAAPRLRDGSLSPVDLTEAVLARLEAVEPRVKAFETVLAESAMSEARAAADEIARGSYRGPLHGIPVAVKDLYDTAGVRTTSSSRVRKDHIPNRDAAAVERLRAAGAVFVGKTVTHEFAYGVVSAPTCNPWNLGHIPGGSSGGSGAALAAGACLGALGTDTGGSIRIPASVCGVAGIKPTYGRVSKFGVAALSWSLDHAGPMARSVADLAHLLGVLAGHDPRDPTTVDVPVPDYTAGLRDGVRGLRLGVPTNVFFDAADPAVVAAVRAAIDGLAREGADIVEVTVPHLEYALAAEFAICVPEASSYHGPTLRRQADDYGEHTRALLEGGELYLATHYLKAQRVRALIKRGFRQAFEGIDALLTPTLPHPAAAHGQAAFANTDGPAETVIDAYVRTCCPFNLSGLPALTVPCGFTSAGLPVGLQVAGRPFDESTVLRVGHAHEAATEWHRRRPVQ